MKTENSKSESFLLNEFSSDSPCFESGQLLLSFCFFPIQGSFERRLGINHCCIIRGNEFSRKVERSRVESFY